MNPFQRGLRFILQYEGGYANHPADPGGATNKGITQRTYDAWQKKHYQPLRDVRLITDEEVERIYYADYFMAAGCQDMPPAMAVCVFDTAVNCGVKKARGWKLLVDGSFKNLSVEQQVREYIGVRRAYYRTRKHFPTFGKGWFNRCAALEALCISLVREEAAANGTT